MSKGHSVNDIYSINWFMHRVLKNGWLSCIFRYSRENKVWQSEQRGFFPTKIRLRYKILYKFNLLGAFQNLICRKKYRKSFNGCESGGCAA